MPNVGDKIVIRYYEENGELSLREVYSVIKAEGVVRAQNENGSIVEWSLSDWSHKSVRKVVDGQWSVDFFI